MHIFDREVVSLFDKDIEGRGREKGGCKEHNQEEEGVQ